MAHLGKHYKVQFRRDLHGDVNNDAGYPEAFGVEWDDLLTPFSFSGLPILFQCINLAKENQPPMIWTSGWYPFDGVMWRTSIELEHPTERIGTVQDVIYELECSTGGIVIAGSGKYTVQNYSSLQTNAFSFVGTVASGYQWGTFTQTLNCNALGWAAYNP